MTSQEVEALLGPPLRKTPWTPDSVNWAYSDSRPGCPDYWMRDIFIENGVVENVVSIYWVD
jgi:hypothetical protein